MHNRSEMVAVLGTLEALPYYIYTLPVLFTECSILIYHAVLVQWTN
jgi:hypothetical protein